MQQLAALVEAAAAGEAWSAEPPVAFPEDSVVTARLLAPSRDPLPPLLLLLVGGVGFILGGWPVMLMLPAMGALLLGRGLRDATWPWLQRRAARELAAALPRFLQARLQLFDGTAVRRGGRIMASGIAMIPSADGARVLVLVQEGVAARVPWPRLLGWAWKLGAEEGSGGAEPPVPAAEGLWLHIAHDDASLWHVALTDPAILQAWAARLDATPAKLSASAPTRERTP
ncbi:hypothetical protein KTR66_17690 [Roseococcus sp. SDR]|uniref:hypothetical protein n=1 Tax=Roseococcus sp. SDR TaxID=2835532 RepID=UPI001BCAD2A0|nr:hypothetical protein [Roseococcus sp. SDR]MBS7791837.1 hypothetical protein [Roseococcus sp. SDR]MBV1847151.1 hypothetical protein [Roseococcus sp. SDR]